MKKMDTKGIDVWIIEGAVRVTPHLEFQKLYSYEELREIAEKVKKQFPELHIRVWPKSTLFSELNGTWNVTMTVPVKGKLYLYMLRRDKYYGKSYGSPIEKPSSVGFFPLSDYKEAFKKIDYFLISFLDGKRINEFPNHY